MLRSLNIGRVLVALLIVVGAARDRLSAAPTFYARLLYLGLLMVGGAWVWVTVVARSLRLTRAAGVLAGERGRHLQGAI